MPASIQGYRNVMMTDRLERYRTGALAAPLPLVGRRFTAQGRLGMVWELRGKWLATVHDGSGAFYAVLAPAAVVPMQASSVTRVAPIVFGHFEPGNEYPDQVQPGGLVAVIDECRTEQLDEFPVAGDEPLTVSGRVQGMVAEDLATDASLGDLQSPPAASIRAELDAAAEQMRRMMTAQLEGQIEGATALTASVRKVVDKVTRDDRVSQAVVLETLRAVLEHFRALSGDEQRRLVAILGDLYR